MTIDSDHATNQDDDSSASEQPWESIGHRFQLPEDLLPILGTRHRLALVPRNVIEHVETLHPVDANVLGDLRDLFGNYEYLDPSYLESTRVVVYSRHDGVWRRGVLAKPLDYRSHAIFVNAYRRDARRVDRLIESGLLLKRGREE